MKRNLKMPEDPKSKKKLAHPKSALNFTSEAKSNEIKPIKEIN